MPNNAVIAKSRAICGSFLSKDDYITLAHKGTIAAAVGFLKTKPRYASVFADTDEASAHREQVESLITKEVFDNYTRICRFAIGSKNSIMSFLQKKLEAEQLSKAVIAVATGMQENYYLSFPPYLMDYVGFDPADAARSKDGRALLSAIRGTMYYKPLKPFLEAPAPDVNDAVTEISTVYIKWAFSKINSEMRGRNAEQLKSFFLHKADVDNLLTCIRITASFGESPDYIRKLLIPFHRKLRPSEIDEALKSNSPTDALRELIKTKKLAAENDGTPELCISRADYKYFRRRLALTNDETEALYALMTLFEAEATNICRVIEGLRYSLPPDEIEKYLITD